MTPWLLVPLAVAVGVHCHGGIFNYTIDGVDYAGQFPWLPEDGQSTIQRRWWGDPIRDVDHPYLACNRGIPLAAHTPTLHAPVRAGGGTITAKFHHPDCPPDLAYPTAPSVAGVGDPDPPVPRCMGPVEGFWFHTHGPMVVYLADCGGPCAAFRPAAGDRVWFKVWEAGLLPGFSVVDRDGWNQFPYANAGWNVSLPRRLRPGNYLVRHEIIYIENDPAQFYPYCAQLAVEGDGDEVPGDEFKVAFPGAYSAADPGIAVAGIFYAPGADQVTTWPMNYTIPGPPVWTGGD